MNILQVSTWDNVGGAGKAAFRLNEALNNSGLDSKLLCTHKTTNDRSVIGPESWLAKKLSLVKIAIDNLPSRLDPQKTFFNSYSWFPGDISDKINSFNPDLVHLHWVGGGFLRPESLMKIKAPIVWTLHDQWPLLGTSHYQLDSAPYSDPNTNNFYFNRSLYERKKSAFNKVKINTVSPSKWLYNQVLVNNVNINGIHKNIPNCINTHKFNPGKSKNNNANFTMLYLAMNADRDIVKGYDLLLKSLEYVKLKATLNIIGVRNAQNQKINNVSINFIPTIHGESEIIDHYRNSNLTILPSLMENLPYAALESIACGTPVLGFDVGGISDVVINNKTGFLIRPFNLKAFGRKIDNIINSDLNRISIKAHKYAKENFSYQVISKKHIEFYDEILGSNV